MQCELLPQLFPGSSTNKFAQIDNNMEHKLYILHSCTVIRCFDFRALLYFFFTVYLFFLDNISEGWQFLAHKVEEGLK